MNLATIAEDFGHQIEEMTAGTKYEISISTEHCIPPMEGRIRTAMFSLWKDAHSLKLALYLERTAKEYFDSLYDFSYGVVTFDEEVSYKSNTEMVALKIISEKTRRTKQIQRLKKAHERYLDILRCLPSEDSEIIVMGLKKQDKTNYEMLRATIERNLIHIEPIYESEDISSEIDPHEEADPIIRKPLPQKTLEKNKKQSLKRLSNLFK